MTITIDTADPRSLKALEVLATADRWVRGHRTDGVDFWVIPSVSAPDRVWWTSLEDCTCPDRQFRRTSCCHMRAVALRQARDEGRRRST